MRLVAIGPSKTEPSVTILHEKTAHSTHATASRRASPRTLEGGKGGGGDGESSVEGLCCKVRTWHDA